MSTIHLYVEEWERDGTLGGCTDRRRDVANKLFRAVEWVCVDDGDWDDGVRRLTFCTTINAREAYTIHAWYPSCRIEADPQPWPAHIVGLAWATYDGDRVGGIFADALEEHGVCVSQNERELLEISPVWGRASKLVYAVMMGRSI